MSTSVLEAMPSVAGEPRCEVFWDAGGEGQGAEFARVGHSISQTSGGGGEGESDASEDSGLEGGLEGTEESGEESEEVEESEESRVMMRVAGRRRPRESERNIGGASMATMAASRQ